MNIKFIVLQSNNLDRKINVEKIKNEIKELFVIESGIDDLFDNFIKCFDLEKEYYGLVLLEDDIKLCRDFYNIITKIIEKNKDDVISFFEQPLSKKELKTTYKNGYDFLYNQCNYYPREICKLINDKNNVKEFKDNYFKKYKVWKYPSDTYVSEILGKYKIKYLMKIPFLVQHLDFKSTLGNRSTKRQTKFFKDDMEGYYE